MLTVSAVGQGTDLQLTLQRDAGQGLTLSITSGPPAQGHTFIEFSTNTVWVPAYFSSSNSTDAFVYSVTNTGVARLFRATRHDSVAELVKASWQRLGVTNYRFHYTRQCFCVPTFMVSATVTVMADEVVKVEDARDALGNEVAEPSLEIAPTIIELLDAWIDFEPDGGYMRELRFDSNGFPTLIALDRAPNAADDEVLYTIDSFTPLP